MQPPIEERLEIAKNAYVSGDFENAKMLLDKIVEEESDSPYGLGARYLRARGLEDGVFQEEQNLSKAYDDFLVLKDRAEEFGSAGIVGCARILFQFGASENRDRILALCVEAIARDSNAKAMMLLGCLNEQVTEDAKSARRWYLRAFMRGLPWGMRFFARSHSKDGNPVRAAMAHVMATVASPILVLFHGVRSPLK